MTESWISNAGFPSLPPPTYLPKNLVSLLDCNGLAAREAEHKKWLLESQVSTCSIPIGMRAMDLEDELGRELDDEEGNDSVEEEEEEPPGARESESAMEEPGDWLVNRFGDESDTTPYNDEMSIQLGDDAVNPNGSVEPSSDSN